jgi:ureidoacrylate peracid hydrolase
MPSPEDEPAPREARDIEFLEEVAPAEDEIVFSKTSAGVFNSTAIENVLHRMGISQLVFTGIVTDGCVELSARDAVDRGFSAMLVTDGCAASTPEAHEDALQRLTDGGFISAKTTEQVLALLSGMASERARRQKAAAV